MLLLLLLLFGSKYTIGKTIKNQSEILQKITSGNYINSIKINFENLENEHIEVTSNISGSRAVKLSMRQGLLMNQILHVYGLDSAKNDVCKRHLQEFRDGLRAFEPWALQSM